MSALLTDRALLWLGALLYLAGFLTGLVGLTRKQSGTTNRNVLNIFLIAGWVVQMAGLYVRGRAVGGCPLGNTFELVQFVAWSAMVLYFFVGPAFRVSVLGLFTAGYAAALAIASLLITQWDVTRGQKIFGNNPWIELHAALAVFSYGVFGLLALTSFMQLLQNWSLKHKRLNGLFWFLPSVVQLDQINLRVLLLGVALLTFSLAVGAAWWVRDLASVDLLKLFITVGVWLAYLVVFLLRRSGRLVSVRFAWVCVILFMIALLSLGPVNSSRHHTIVLTPAGE
ncbi:cytochrome C assembly family protein [Oleiharenicola lentus]|uniref:cytochrome C assembly family protein n=1 Tax=Oleiharenicola lentus TaxID=2508720 RepID=UPI003F680392